MTSVAERLAYIDRFPRPVLTELVDAISREEPLNVAAWINHLHTADEATLDHMAAAAEALRTSPAVVLMREAVDFERARRIVTAGLQVTT